MIVAIMDYRACNLTSVVKAFVAAGATPRVVTQTAGIAGANAIVVPGVGHFEATRAIDEDDRREIRRCVEAGVPLLGICLGMQWLFEGSDEAPALPGLGVFAGRCTRIDLGLETQAELRKPADGSEGMGSVADGSEGMESVADGSEGMGSVADGSEGMGSVADGSEGMGFSPCRTPAIKIPHVGWNTLEPTGRPSRLLDGMPAGATAYFTHSYAAPDGDGTVARTTHGATFASVVERGRVFGTQFHPEKSGATGIEMLKRFVAIAREANVQC